MDAPSEAATAISDAVASSANAVYELTFLLCGIICAIYVLGIRRDRLIPRQEGPKLLGAAFETAGQFAYIFALSDTAHAMYSAPHNILLLRPFGHMEQGIPQRAAFGQALRHGRDYYYRNSAAGHIRQHEPCAQKLREPAPVGAGSRAYIKASRAARRGYIKTFYTMQLLKQRAHAARPEEIAYTKTSGSYRKKFAALKANVAAPPAAAGRQSIFILISPV